VACLALAGLTSLSNQSHLELIHDGIFLFAYELAVELALVELELELENFFLCMFSFLMCLSVSVMR